MKFISYCLISIVSIFFVILLSLSGCSPTPKATTNPAIVQPTPTLPTVQATGSPSPQPADVIIKIRNFKFEPADLTIALGKTVQFINLDEEPHTATASTFDSKALDTNQTWNYKATQPGVFPYICAVHPFMKGQLTVKSTSPSTPPST